MANHGPFTIGRTARAAVKAAAMCEEVARTVTIARQGGEPYPIDSADIDSLYSRYQNAYGQRTLAEGRSVDMSSAPAAGRRRRGVVPDRQPGPLRPRGGHPGRGPVPAHRRRPRRGKEIGFTSSGSRC